MKRNRKKLSAFPGDFRIIEQETNNSNNCDQNKYSNVYINKPCKITSISESFLYVVPDSHQYKVFVVFLQYLIRI